MSELIEVIIKWMLDIPKTVQEQLDFLATKDEYKIGNKTQKLLK